MTEVEVRNERCPFCNVEIDWDKIIKPKTFGGNCPNCGKSLNLIKIRFL